MVEHCTGVDWQVGGIFAGWGFLLTTRTVGSEVILLSAGRSSRTCFLRNSSDFAGYACENQTQQEGVNDPPLVSSPSPLGCLAGVVNDDHHDNNM